MTSDDTVRSAVADLLTTPARDALASIDVPAIDPHALTEYLARLRFAAPTFLPFATYDGSILGIHLWPGRPLAQSAIYYVPSDEQSATFLCGGLADLPIGLWLWVARYFKTRTQSLRGALEVVQAEIPGGRAVPEVLWRILDAAPDDEPTWWNADSSTETQAAWQAAKVGHPFVAVPSLVEAEEPEQAIAILQPYVDQHPHAAPEIVSALLAAQAQLGVSQQRTRVLQVLAAEAERGGKTVFWGPWRDIGDGLAEWDIVLRGVQDRGSMFEATPFAPLAEEPDTYSGHGEGGAARLVGIAERFLELGDAAAGLRQLRNAAWLAALGEGEVSSELCIRMSDASDQIEARSLAGALARACTEIPTSAA